MLATITLLPTRQYVVKHAHVLLMTVEIGSGVVMIQNRIANFLMLLLTFLQEPTFISGGAYVIHFHLFVHISRTPTLQQNQVQRVFDKKGLQVAQDLETNKRIIFLEPNAGGDVALMESYAGTEGEPVSSLLQTKHTHKGILRSWNRVLLQKGSR